MDAAEALADLTELSTQVREAAVLDRGGPVTASTLGDEDRARRFGDAVRAALETAERARPGVTELEASAERGSLFIVADGARVVAAVTEREQPAGLVLYDLRTCLRKLADG